MKGYKLVFIDADDTLFDYKAAEKFALTQSLNQYEIDCNIQIINDYSQINKQLWLDYENNKITQEALRIERFNRLFDKMHQYIDAANFSDVYLRYLAESSFLFNDAIDICSYLHIPKIFENDHIGIYIS
jgi:FMN phosphatase YigB (HAD superfamily)